MCYLLAQVVQSENIDDDRARALFLRSCKLGIDSGCTNAAAGLGPDPIGQNVSASRIQCENRTYEIVCAKGDPWACTMLGNHLGRGIGFEIDYDRARTALESACDLDAASEACEYARKNLEGIEKMEHRQGQE